PRLATSAADSISSQARANEISRRARRRRDRLGSATMTSNNIKGKPRTAATAMSTASGAKMRRRMSRGGSKCHLRSERSSDCGEVGGAGGASAVDVLLDPGGVAVAQLRQVTRAAGTARRQHV